MYPGGEKLLYFPICRNVAGWLLWEQRPHLGCLGGLLLLRAPGLEWSLSFPLLVSKYMRLGGNSRLVFGELHLQKSESISQAVWQQEWEAEGLAGAG